jgi:hypothetical protein
LFTFSHPFVSLSLRDKDHMTPDGARNHWPEDNPLLSEQGDALGLRDGGISNGAKRGRTE